MWQILRRDPRAFGAALLLHLVLVALTLVSVDWLATADKAPTKPWVVQATIVDSKAIEAGGRQAEARRKAEEKARRQAEARRKAEEQAQRQAEAKRKAEEKARRQAEARRKAEEQAQRQAEAKRKAEKKARRQAEARRKAEEQVLRQAEAKRKAEEKARRQAEARRRAEKETEAQRAREEALQAALEAEQAASNLGVYKRKIRERIHRIWVRQPGMGWDLSCGVEVRLIPGGEVIPSGVRVTRSSGNPAFDQSVVVAVYKASPLPVPSGRLFEQFRNLKLVFKP